MLTLLIPGVGMGGTPLVAVILVHLIAHARQVKFSSQRVTQLKARFQRSI